MTIASITSYAFIHKRFSDSVGDVNHNMLIMFIKSQSDADYF